MNPKDLFDISADEIIRLPSVPLVDRDQIPSAPGIYFALSGTNQILYIGRSRDMLTRWVHHHRYEELQTLGGTRLAFIVVDTTYILGGLERTLIKRFRPPINDVFTAPPPNAREVEDVFGDKKVIDYLADPGGAMPIVLKDAIKKFAEPVCSYCGGTDLHARNIRMEIFDAKRFAETHDFSYTGLTCNGCGVVRGGGSFHNSEKMRDALYERLTRALNRAIHLTEPFGIDAGSFYAMREQISPESFTFYNENANDTESKAEQGGTGQPATRPESKSECSDKPQPEAEGRSR